MCWHTAQPLLKILPVDSIVVKMRIYVDRQAQDGPWRVISPAKQSRLAVRLCALVLFCGDHGVKH
jgi:hypothetical protein